MDYNFREIEQRWKQYWDEHALYRVPNDSAKPKCYVLDMFPYPSGAGLHVGHPLGYIASDIYARFKRLKGFNVLHPMGFDAFGLPAEQYALETGKHPAVTTAENIARYRRQLDNIGFCYDWTREVRTSDPRYYRWTQWIFLQLFESWYDRAAQRARPVAELKDIFSKEGNRAHPCPEDGSLTFDAAQWKAFGNKRQEEILMRYRIAYLSYSEVWWCEGLGTVLANDEVVNGVSERGGFPVVRRRMRQWYLRITEYADRLIAGLDTVQFSEAMKEMQTNWIGRSTGLEIRFRLEGKEEQITVYTTRPDTIFGADFLVLAPEHRLASVVASPERQQAVAQYQEEIKSRSERERMAEKKISGVFTGAYALHPFTGAQMPVWISEYILAGYGTGAIMGVPSGDERDLRFAGHFGLPVTNIFGEAFNGKDAVTDKSAALRDSDFLTGLSVAAAIDEVAGRIEAMGLGKRKINYKLRDAAFSRQRYWGEPFPIRWEDGVAVPLPESALPLELPHVSEYKPGPDGEGPLANIPEWTDAGLETNTMPGYAGSSWYFLRYADPHNEEHFAGKKATDYWNQVDVYVGGTEHAVGHLLYSRMWTKALYDLGHISFDEPFKKLVNQGMIQGSSRFVQRIGGLPVYLSADRTPDSITAQERQQYGLPSPLPETASLHVDVRFVDGVELDTDAFRAWRPEYAGAQFIPNADGKFLCTAAVEKMSKSKYNVVNPDDIVAQYGADTFRMYEMFLGPLDVSKPWDTKGIEGVHRFLKKLWRLFYNENGWVVNDDGASEDELRILHKTIRKTEEDIERFACNTVVSQLMICVNELSALACHKREILEPLVVTIAALAPHVAEELWHALGHESSVLDAPFPKWEPRYLEESSKLYPVAINGRTRLEMSFPLDAAQADVEAVVLADEQVQKWLEGKTPKKVVYVRGRMINLVV